MLFGKISECCLRLICNYQSQRIDIVFNRYESPSIKDSERDSRQCDRETSYEIVCPLQKRPNDFMNALKQYNFKETFVEFLVENWENDLYSDIVRDKQVYITSKERCYSFHNVNGKLKKNEEHQLYS